ncbi:LysE family translocator [Roseobacter sp.]|uniref:LysE family translocator n=1 Tax=Roseobacter sp. TaxID=1907202 RepID=UPI003858401D
MTISLADLLLYSGALVILFMTPGPVWLALMARALSGGFAAAWPLALGVAVGDVIWPLVAILGVSWILSVFDVFMVVMRWVACGVFVVMGALLIKHARAQISTDSRLTRPGLWPGFLAGLIAILGNPKAVLFYMGVLPGFFDLRAVTRWDVAAILAVSVAIPMLGNLMLAACVGQIRSIITAPQTLVRINVTSGILLILVGVLIPLI